MLEPANIRECWESIRGGVQCVIALSKADYRPEDVYAACVQGLAFLYVDEPGFVILAPQVNVFTGRRELLVWIAYAEGQGNIEAYQPQIDAIAQREGFATLTCWTARRGFAKVPGWREVATVYERSVNEPS
jgi:hypothetical protein